MDIVRDLVKNIRETHLMDSPAEFNQEATPAFKKRSKTLKKNAGELATLCDIHAMFICFGPKQEAVTWPENKQDIQIIISRYHDSRSSDEDARPTHESSKIRSLDAKLQEVDARIELLVHQNQPEHDYEIEVDEDEIDEEDDDSHHMESGDSTEDEDEDEAIPKTRNFIANLARNLAAEPVPDRNVQSEEMVELVNSHSIARLGF